MYNPIYNYQLKGFFIALLIAPLITIPIYILSIGLLEPHRFLYNVRFALAAPLIAYPVTMIAGIPIHLILHRRTRDKLIYYILIGALLPILAVSGELLSPNPRNALQGIAIFVPCGIAVATTFRLIIDRYKS